MSGQTEILWSPTTHPLFCRSTRQEIETVTPLLSSLPPELIDLICQYVPDRQEVTCQKPIDGMIIWRQKGLIHHEIGPAYIDQQTGLTKWYKENKLHRLDGPAVTEKSIGREEWFVEGKRHRDGDLPAVILGDDREEEWWVNDLKHRDNGPASIDRDRGILEYWKHGIFIDQEEVPFSM